MNSIPKETHDRPMSRFLLIWSGQAFSLLGSNLVGFALVWWLTEQTGSATVLATAALVAMLPQVLFSPIAGALVDRWNRRLVMIVADSAIALLTAGLAYLFFSGLIQVWHIYVIMMLRSLGAAFQWPAMQASTTLLVPERHLQRINGMNQALQGAMTVMGPPLGALLLAVLPVQGVLLIDVGTAVLAVAPLLVTRIPQPLREDSDAAGKRPSVLADVREGIAFIMGWPGLVAIIGIALIINLLVNPAMAVLPLLVTDHFGGGALQLGWLQASWGAGMLIGGLALSVWGGFKRGILTGLLGITGLGVGLVVAGMAPSDALWLAIVGFLLASSMNALANGALFALLQKVVPPDKQGRVFTILIAAVTMATPIGLAVAGPLVDAFSVNLWIVVGGVASVLLGVAGLLLPVVMNVEEQMSGQQAAEVPVSVR